MAKVNQANTLTRRVRRAITSHSEAQHAVVHSHYHVNGGVWSTDVSNSGYAPVDELLAGEDVEVKFIPVNEGGFWTVTWRSLP